MTRILPLTLALTITAASGAAAQTLTAEDYVEIRNVAQYYNLGYDSTARADGGAVVARAFAADMTFTRDGGPNWYSSKAMADYAGEGDPGCAPLGFELRHRTTRRRRAAVPLHPGAAGGRLGWAGDHRHRRSRSTKCW